MTLPLVDFPSYEGNATALYNSVTTSASEALQSGSFRQSLLTTASNIGGNAFFGSNGTNSTVEIVTFAEPTFNYPPTASPTSKKSDNSNGSSD
eukprot:1441655-Alexandrium_andersonii.AAC.1